MKTRFTGPQLGDRKITDEERMLPSISTEHGGLKPGIDLESTAELLEFDDLAKVRRLYTSRPKPR